MRFIALHCTHSWDTIWHQSFCWAAKLPITNKVTVTDKSASDADAWLLLKSWKAPKQNLKLATCIKIPIKICLFTVYGSLECKLVLYFQDDYDEFQEPFLFCPFSVFCMHPTIRFQLLSSVCHMKCGRNDKFAPTMRAPSSHQLLVLPWAARKASPFAKWRMLYSGPFNVQNNSADKPS